MFKQVRLWVGEKVKFVLQTFSVCVSGLRGVAKRRKEKIKTKAAEHRFEKTKNNTYYRFRPIPTILQMNKGGKNEGFSQSAPQDVDIHSCHARGNLNAFPEETQKYAREYLALLKKGASNKELDDLSKTYGFKSF